jgi:hypothetical protein
MKKLGIAIAAIATLASGGPAIASHVNNLDIPFASRGACEAYMQQLSQDDREWLQVAFPWYFSTDGQVESFLRKAFTCEENSSDDQFYITDHRLEVLGSDWFLRHR